MLGVTTTVLKCTQDCRAEVTGLEALVATTDSPAVGKSPVSGEGNHDDAGLESRCQTPTLTLAL